MMIVERALWQQLIIKGEKKALSLKSVKVILSLHLLVTKWDLKRLIKGNFERKFPIYGNCWCSLQQTFGDMVISAPGYFWGRWASNPTSPPEQMHQGVNSSSQCRSGSISGVPWSLGQCGQWGRGFTADQMCPLRWNPSHSATTGYNMII